MATGGSTNAVLHLLALAREAGVKLALDDFDRIARRTPLLADLEPWGRLTAPEMFAAGGMSQLSPATLERVLSLHESTMASAARSPGMMGVRRPASGCRPSVIDVTLPLDGLVVSDEREERRP